jgi:hypothetical protein
MSEENVERFHRIYEEWYARRRLGPDLLAEAVEWVNPHDAVEGGSRQGAKDSTRRSRAFLTPGTRFGSKPSAS